MDLKTRTVIRGTLKAAGKAELNVARGSLKTADATKSFVKKQLAEPDGSASEGAANRLTGYERKALADANRRVKRAGRRSAVKSARLIRRARKEAAIKREMEAAAANMPKAAAGAANMPATTAAAAPTVKGAASSSKLKAGTRGVKTAAAQAAKGSYDAALAMRKAAAEQRGAKKAVRTVYGAVKAAAKAVIAAVKKVLNSVTFAVGGGFVVLVIAIVICICGSVSIFFQSTGETPELNTPAPAVYYYLRTRLGLNSAAACGVMANIEAESGFSTGALGDDGTSIGLCQWHNGRFENLYNYCYGNGYDPTSLSGQLEYLNYELHTGYSYILDYLYSVEDNVGGCYDAGEYFCVNFERPANAEEKGAERGSNAISYYWNYAASEGTEQGMALAYTAYNELGNDGGQKYWSWYGFSRRVEWCAIFVSWCANQNGYIDAGIMPKSCNVDSYANGYAWYYSHGQSLDATGAIPQPGWIAFFGRGHTGIVYAQQGDTFWLVEGNSNDAVNLNQYTLADAPSIMWYCIPPYTH